ncbi:hypothetical protein E8E13_003993 [Curvularia kusanoi]|uniref:Uncharacterized protein n=1 Tax=Curvularia kusanoi TaxID=90978 RepID=A0A9P4W704_CURKU|nr:hypothetical protein E8E13_003993 [Curvularia kusanoi]
MMPQRRHWCAVQSSISAFASSEESSAVRTFGLTRPSSAKTLEFKFDKGPSTRFPPSQKDAPASSPCVQPDTAIPSVESAEERKPQQDDVAIVKNMTVTHRSSPEQIVVSSTRSVSQDCQPPAQTEEPLNSGATEQVDLSADAIEPAHSEPSTKSDIQTRPHLASSLKKGTGKNGRQGRKRLLSGPLRPWPPRQEKVLPGTFSASSLIAGIDPEYGKGDTGAVKDVTSLIVECQSDENTVPENAPHGVRELSSVPEVTQRAQLEATATEPVPDGLLLTLAGYEPSRGVRGHNSKHVLPQRAQEISDDTIHYRPVAPESENTEFPPPANSIQNHINGQQTPPATDTVDQGATLKSQAREAGMHRTPPRKSHNSDSNRVTKSGKQNQSASGGPKILSGHPALPGMADFDTAFSNFRSVCLAEISQIESRHSSEITELKAVNVRLQETISHQSTTISEQRCQIDSEKHQHAKLAETAKSHQKYVSGLQKDHEKLRKLVASTEEQAKEALQAKIDEVVQEKEDLRVEFDSTVDILSKNHKALWDVTKETYTCYLAAQLREGRLQEQLEERALMHEEEKNRRIELENRLLPAVLNMQIQAKEGSTALLEALASLRTDFQVVSNEDERFRTTKECLSILEKLQGHPVLTHSDVRKVESTLRSLHERIESGFEALIVRNEHEPSPAESIRRSVKDQIQGLQEEILQHLQVVTDDNKARETVRSLRLELDAQTVQNKQLEQQIDTSHRADTSSRSKITQLEKRNEELQALSQKQHDMRQQSELAVMQLQGQLSKRTEAISLADNSTKQQKRLLREQKLEFRKYRSAVLLKVDELTETLEQLTTSLQNKDRECANLLRNMTKLKSKLDSTEMKRNKASCDLSLYKMSNGMLRQKNKDMTEAAGRTQDLLGLADQSNKQLEMERDRLTAEAEKLRESLRNSQYVETQLNIKGQTLLEQIHELQTANAASNESFQEDRDNMDARLQQMNVTHSAEIEELQSKLNLSEKAQEELKKELQQAEATSKQRAEQILQKTKEKWDDLVKYSRQDAESRVEKLMQEHEKERERLIDECKEDMQTCERDAESKMAACRQDADLRIENIRQETEKQLRAAEIPPSKTLDPDSQQSESAIEMFSASQDLRTAKTRKKVDRHSNSAMNIKHSHRQVVSRDGGSIIGTLDHHESGRDSTEDGFFEEEFESRFGTQASIQDQDAQSSLSGNENMLVPETQNFECAIERIANDVPDTQDFEGTFGACEVVPETQNVEPQQDTGTELSSISSEELSDMGQSLQRMSNSKRTHSKKSVSSNYATRTPETAESSTDSDAQTTLSQSRPKSQANTASRIMRPPVPEVSRRRNQPDPEFQHLVSTHSRHVSNVGNASAGTASTRDVVQEQMDRHHDPLHADKTASSQKRKSAVGAEESGSFKKFRNSAQPDGQRSSSASNSSASSVPSRTESTGRNTDVTGVQSSMSHRTSSQYPFIADSQRNVGRASKSNRRKQSKASQYSERFNQELDKP